MAQIEEVRIRVLPEGRVSRAGAAAFLGYDPKTLAQWAWAGKGPLPRKVPGSNRVFYRIADLKAFLATGAREAA